jgi:predicted DNA-binding protein YlxM (UPF0122 family)
LAKKCDRLAKRRRWRLFSQPRFCKDKILTEIRKKATLDICKGVSLNKRGGSFMLEKTTRMNYLYDFYQALLTPKQRSYMSLYYLDDYSLGEIAEQYEVSRQAVYDNIKRTETMLEEYEKKLSLFQKFQKRKQLMDQLKDYVLKKYGEDQQLFDMIKELEELE